MFFFKTLNVSFMLEVCASQLCLLKKNAFGICFVCVDILIIAHGRRKSSQQRGLMNQRIAQQCKVVDLY